MPTIQEVEEYRTTKQEKIDQQIQQQSEKAALSIQVLQKTQAKVDQVRRRKEHEKNEKAALESKVPRGDVRQKKLTGFESKSKRKMKRLLWTQMQPAAPSQEKGRSTSKRETR